MDVEPTPDPPRSLTAQAYERLRSDIISGALRPREKLKIHGLVERYGVGATAIREALSRLVSESLVEVEEQRGFFVAPASRADLEDLTRTRVQIESLALGQAIANGDVEWESALLSAFHRLSKTPPPTTPERHDAWAHAHRTFHEALIAGCGSPWLMRLCRLLYDKSERYRNLAESRTTPGRRDAVAEHRQLLDAAMARDAQATCRLIEEHFRATSDIVLAADCLG